MKVVKSVVFEKEDRQVFKEAALAMRVGDPHNERETGVFTGLIRDASPVSEARLTKARLLLIEVVGAVMKERQVWEEAAEALEAVEEKETVPPTKDAVPLVTDPLLAARVIIEAREKFESDLYDALMLIELAHRHVTS